MIHYDLPYADYDALPGIRSGDLSRLAKSPRHYRYSDGGADTASRAFLRAIHARILEPLVYASDFAVCDVKRDPRTTAFQNWLAEHPGVTPITATDADKVAAIARAIEEHPEAGPLIAIPGASEVTLTWIDSTGVECKGRIDRLTKGGAIIDLKGYGTSDPRVLGRRVVAGGAHVQAAHYRAGLAAHGVTGIRNVLICYEVTEPFDVAVVELEVDEAIAAGEAERRRLLELLATCRRTGEWPGRCPTITPLALPPWAWADEEELTL